MCPGFASSLPGENCTAIQIREAGRSKLCLPALRELFATTDGDGIDIGLSNHIVQTKDLPLLYNDFNTMF
jgi:hypothetical protein